MTNVYAAAVRRQPATSGTFAPTEVESLPAIGPTTSMPSVAGRRKTPACVTDAPKPTPPDAGSFARDSDPASRGAADLEAVFDVPVKVSAVLGRARMEVGDLLRLGPGAVLELDRKVGEAIDLYVNDRLVARGEVVLVEDKLGVTMTEIIKADRN